MWVHTAVNPATVASVGRATTIGAPLSVAATACPTVMSSSLGSDPPLPVPAGVVVVGVSFDEQAAISGTATATPSPVRTTVRRDRPEVGDSSAGDPGTRDSWGVDSWVGDPWAGDIRGSSFGLAAAALAVGRSCVGFGRA